MALLGDLLMISLMFSMLIAVDSFLYNKSHDGIEGWFDSWKSDFRKLVS